MNILAGSVSDDGVEVAGCMQDKGGIYGPHIIVK